MNNDTHSDGIFAYYKDVKDVLGNVWAPPVGIDGRAQHKWMKNICPTSTSNVGTELDWMNFYYALHTLGGSGVKFYFTQIRDTYLDACGGDCDGVGVSWSALSTAVEARYGEFSPRTQHWVDQSTGYGVDQ